MKEYEEKDIILKILAWIWNLYEEFASLRNAYIEIGVLEATKYLFWAVLRGTYK